LLKDIFPQNAVDIGLLSKMNPFFWYFKALENRLYGLSDRIGCMSPANLSYVIQEYPEHTSRVEINPNSIELTKSITVKTEKNKRTRELFGLPLNKTLIIYGGNLGLPQGIPFLVEVISRSFDEFNDVHFVIAGSGTESWRFNSYSKNNLSFLGHLTIEDFERVTAACDIGIISLDSRFTIPNFPSRLLSYLSNRLPILCFVDDQTDIGKIAVTNDFGLSALHGNLLESLSIIEEMTHNSNVQEMGEIGFRYFEKNYNVQVSINTINKFFVES
jgi:glycosyltransferase involved in cell wall biosynthesis